MTTHIVEYCPTDRSKCQSCETMIMKDSVRVGIVVKDREYGQLTHWRHLLCFDKPETVHDGDAFGGYAFLKEDDQIEFDYVVFNIPRPHQKKKSKKGKKRPSPPRSRPPLGDALDNQERDDVNYDLDLANMRVGDVRAELRQRGDSAKGIKSELVERLRMLLDTEKLQRGGGSGPIHTSSDSIAGGHEHGHGHGRDHGGLSEYHNPHGGMSTSPGSHYDHPTSKRELHIPNHHDRADDHLMDHEHDHHSASSHHPAYHHSPDALDDDFIDDNDTSYYTSPGGRTRRKYRRRTEQELANARLWDCRACSKSYTTKQNVITHIRSAHEDQAEELLKAVKKKLMN